MTIETKLDYNQNAWFIDVHNGKAACLPVYEIMINCYSYTPTIRYRMKASDGPIFTEDKLFPTKDELLKSL